jgi:hypothetical protein
MTITKTLTTIRTLGLTATHRDGEFRINYRGGDEKSAYYTTDSDDALDTAVAMNKRRAAEIARDIAEANGIADDYIKRGRRA